LKYGWALSHVCGAIASCCAAFVPAAKDNHGKQYDANDLAAHASGVPRRSPAKLHVTVVLSCIPIGGIAMSHLSAHKADLLKRVRRIAGQVQAIERSLESDADCEKVLHLVAATRGAMNGLLEEVVEAHAREHVAHPDLTASQRKKGVDALLGAIRRYSK
jgi:FrmR/RcnR family transcriptional regulator, repressor of frmRAB operon